jgi:hypothetical protein
LTEKVTDAMERLGDRYHQAAAMLRAAIADTGGLA